MIGPMVFGGARFLVFDVYVPEGCIILMDMGPWHRHRTLTNAAEAVVKMLHGCGLLPGDKRVLYIASDGEREEMLHQGGVFQGFRHGWELDGAGKTRAMLLESSDRPAGLPGDR